MFQPATALLFAAGAITDLTPFLCPAEPQVPGGTLASRPVVGRVPRMRTAEEGGPAGRSAAPGRSVAPRRETRPFGNLTG